MEGIRRALVLGIVLIAGAANEHAPSVGQQVTFLPGPSDDDDRYPHTGRLQYKPPSVIDTRGIILGNRISHHIGEYDIWL